MILWSIFRRFFLKAENDRYFADRTSLLNDRPVSIKYKYFILTSATFPKNVCFGSGHFKTMVNHLGPSMGRFQVKAFIAATFDGPLPLISE